MEKRFKGLCFAGREHHVKKLRYTMDYLQEREFGIEYITGNNVLNWDNYESPLLQQGKTYHHLLDFLDPALIVEIQTLNTLLQEAQNIFTPGQMGFGDYISDFFVRFSLRDVAETFILFRTALKQIRPDVVFILHECNFWTKALAYQANLLGIAVVSFQEGQYARSTAPDRFSTYPLLSEFSSVVLLWGRREVELLACNEQALNRLRVVGVPHLDKYLNLSEGQKALVRDTIFAKNKLPNSRKLILFAAPHSGFASGNLSVLISDLVEYFRQRPYYTLLIRFHPFETHLKARFERLWENVQNINCDQFSETPDLVTAIDLCLCQRTSLGLECLALGKPLIEINYGHSNEDPVSYANQGVAGLISCQAELNKLSRQLESASTDLSTQVLDPILEESFFSLDGKTSERIYIEVRKLLG
jgi:hypothetical protein